MLKLAMVPTAKGSPRFLPARCACDRIRSLLLNLVDNIIGCDIAVVLSAVRAARDAQAPS